MKIWLIASSSEVGYRTSGVCYMFQELSCIDVRKHLAFLWSFFTLLSCFDVRKQDEMSSLTLCYVIALRCTVASVKMVEK
jgi:hypothetical protein